jgi:hypothetical protein
MVVVVVVVYVVDVVVVIRVLVKQLNFMFCHLLALAIIFELMFGSCDPYSTLLAVFARLAPKY